MSAVLVFAIIQLQMASAQDLNAIEFKSKTAKDAVREYLRWEGKAVEAFEKEKKKATMELLTGLEDAFKKEKSRGEIDEALKIRNTIEEIEKQSIPSTSSIESKYIGRWNLKYSAGAIHQVEIRKSGTKLYFSLVRDGNISNPEQGEIVIKENAAWMTFEQGKRVSRFHVDGERIIAEHWYLPNSKNTSSFPEQFIIGVRAEQ